MYMYFCRGGGGYNDRMVNVDDPAGFVLVDPQGQSNQQGDPWMWVYERFEVWVGEGEDREMRGFQWKCRDAEGSPLDPETAQEFEQVEYEPLPDMGF
jgi:hypothetical protein